MKYIRLEIIVFSDTALHDNMGGRTREYILV